MTKTKAQTSMIHYIPITKARVNLGQVVRRAHLNKEYFILEKDGIPVAGILGVDELEDYLELQNPKVKRQIQQSFRQHQAGSTRPAKDFLTDLHKETKKR